METAWLLPDKKLWFLSDDVFLPGIVVGLTKTGKEVEIAVENSDKKLTVPSSSCFQKS
jgi:hypothetical protein